MTGAAVSIEGIRARLTELGVSFHHRTGEAKLRELLASAEAGPQAPPDGVLRRAPAERPPLRYVDRRDPLTLPEDELVLFAAAVGVPRRDIETLSLDRLRVNAAHAVRSTFQALHED